MKIIKKGHKTKPKDIMYVKKCNVCGCIFTYKLNDILFDYDGIDFVFCPDCNYQTYIFFKKKYKGDSNE